MERGDSAGINGLMEKISLKVCSLLAICPTSFPPDAVVVNSVRALFFRNGGGGRGEGEGGEGMMLWLGGRVRGNRMWVSGFV